MDEIQKILVKAGRKDLAQKYYVKVAKGKCPASGCVGKKPNGKWGVMSNKTGKWWPADYDTEKDAQDGLKAYHVHK